MFRIFYFTNLAVSRKVKKKNFESAMSLYLHFILLSLVST